MTNPRTSDETEDWDDDNGYIDLTRVIERLDLAHDASEQPPEDDNES